MSIDSKKSFLNLNQKRKAEIETKKKTLNKGPTSDHIAEFVQAVMDVLDKHGKNGYILS